MKTNLILEAVVDPATQNVVCYKVVKLVNRYFPEVGRECSVADIEFYAKSGEPFEIRFPKKKAPRKCEIKTNANEIIEQIAKKHLNIKTLKTRGSDDLDFSAQSVRAIRESLLEAFNAGLTKEV